MTCVFESSCVKFDIDTLVDNSCSAVFSRFIRSALKDAWNDEIPQEEKFTHFEDSDIVGDSVYDIYETTYNNITFEFIVEHRDGKLVKIFINAKSIAADLKRSKRVTVEEDVALHEALHEALHDDDKNKNRAISASNEDIEVAFKAFGFDDSERFICACRYRKSKSEFDITEPRFFCELDAFCEFMCRYRGVAFRNWVRGKEFVTDGGAYVYCLWGKSKINGAKYFVKAGRTERLNERLSNIEKDTCEIYDNVNTWVQHGSAAEAAVMKVFLNRALGFKGEQYKKEWVKFDTESRARAYYTLIHEKVLKAGLEAKIAPFVSKPQRTVHRDDSKRIGLCFARLAVEDKVEQDGKGNKKRAFKLTPFENSEITYDDWKSMKKALKEKLEEEYDSVVYEDTTEDYDWQEDWSDTKEMTTGGEDL